MFSDWREILHLPRFQAYSKMNISLMNVNVNYFHMWEHTHVCPLHREKRCWSECLSPICKCAKNTMGKRCSPMSEVTESQSQFFLPSILLPQGPFFIQGTANGLQRRSSKMEGENCANGLDQTWGLGETKLKLDAWRKEISMLQMRLGVWQYCFLL